MYNHSSEVIRTNTSNSEREIAALLVERLSELPRASDTIIPVQGPVTFPPSTLVQATLPKRGPGRPKKTDSQIQRRRYRVLTTRERELLKADLESGMGHQNAADKYQVSLGTVSNIEKAITIPKPRGGEVYRKLTPEASKLLSKTVLGDKFVTANQLVAVLHEQGVDVHKSSVNRHLRSPIMQIHGCPRFSVKRVRTQEDNRNSPEVLRFRKEFVATYQTLRRTGSPFIFLDESSFNCMENRYEGRSPIGVRCINRRRRVKINNITAITAISDLLGIIHVTFVEGKVDDSVFKLFLTSLLGNLQIKLNNEPVVIVMDNASIHKTQGVQDVIQSANHKLLFNAPWSCELNPIEYVFGLWKSKVIIPTQIIKIVDVLPILDESFIKINRAQKYSICSIRRDNTSSTCMGHGAT